MTVVRPPVGAEAAGDAGLGVGVDGRGGLDEHEDVRVGGEGAHEHESLSLPAGQSAAALLELALPPAREGVEDVVGSGGVQCQLGLLARQPAERVDGRAQTPRDTWGEVSLTRMCRRTSSSSTRDRSMPPTVTPHGWRARSSSRLAAPRGPGCVRSALVGPPGP